MTTYYKKEGRRYVPVLDYDSGLLSALPKGSHLVTVKPGSQSTRCDINPAFAEVLAALKYAQDAMSEAMVKASEFRPPAKSYTPEQLEALKHFQSLLDPEDRYYLQASSIAEIVQAGIDAIACEAQELFENPTVKAAREQYLLVAELTKQNDSI